MVTCNVFNNPKLIDATFKNSPFSLKNDTKGLTEEELNKIAKNIADEIICGFGRKACALLYNKGKKYVLGFAKVRCEDEKRKKGKSGGYRCIVLVDEEHEVAFLLHIFNHSKKENVSRKETNSLKKLVDEYIDSIESQK